MESPWESDVRRSEPPKHPPRPANKHRRHAGAAAFFHPFSGFLNTQRGYTGELVAASGTPAARRIS
jgi:hypothetical protein